MLLFQITGVRDDIIISLMPSELATMGTGPEAGQVGACRYIVGRAPDGPTRLAPAGLIAVLRNESLRSKGYRPALPVAPPPAN